MDKTMLDFEAPLYELAKKINETKDFSSENKLNISPQLQTLEKDFRQLTVDIYSNLSNWQITQVARHPQRPFSMDYINNIFTDFTELHGDRNFADDNAVICGIAKFNDQSVVIIAQQRGRDTEENIKRNFGMMRAEGYRKALRFMQFAEKFNKPIITFVDTVGAYPGIESEERSVGEAIARNLREMSVLKVPVITVVIGEGGSGGALGIAVANRVLMLEYAIYSVISPESCAAILWRDSNEKVKAAQALKNSAKDAFKLGIIDEIVKEPIGAAHNDPTEASRILKEAINKNLQQLIKLTPAKLIDQRIKKFTQMGVYKEI